MCNGFGGIVTANGDFFFSEPDYHGNCSHSRTLDRKRWEDTSTLFWRPFVRVQFSTWAGHSFMFDEDDTLPLWAANARDEIRTKTQRVMERVLPHYTVWKREIDDAYEVQSHANTNAELDNLLSGPPTDVGNRKENAAKMDARDACREAIKKANEKFYRALARFPGYVADQPDN